MTTKGFSPLRNFTLGSPRKVQGQNGNTHENGYDGGSAMSTASRAPLCPIPLPSQLTDGIANDDCTMKSKSQAATPQSKSKMQHRSDNSVLTPDKHTSAGVSAVGRNRFGWHHPPFQAVSGTEKDCFSLSSSPNAKHGNESLCENEVKEIRTPTKLIRNSSGSDASQSSMGSFAPEGQTNPNYVQPNLSRASTSNQSTPRSVRSMRSNIMDSDNTGGNQSAQTPNRNVSRTLKYSTNIGTSSSGVSSIRPGISGTKLTNPLSQPLRTVQTHSSECQSINAPYFDLEEDPSFWNDHNVQVLIRCRPLNKSEITSHGYSLCLRQESSHTITWVGPPESRFTFDHVACEKITQEKLFKIAGIPMVDNCMSGYNSCMFAYGQTGSGKTHTMLGAIDDLVQRPSENRGMTPRIFDYLFGQISMEEEMRKHECLKFSCKCSFLEIYNEQITDLLEPSSTNLQMREDVRKGVYVDNLREVEVMSVQDVVQLLLQGAANRRVAATNMNQESSRSHSVFTCVIESKWESDSMTNIRFGRLNLVDLAGSERQKSSGAEGERLREAANINKSLSTLGLVIMILVDVAQGKQRHVPYRDSKLTFLLQDSLGGNSKTTIIANVSPSVSCASETLSTLKFAQRAKFIRNNAIVNEDASGDVMALRLQIQQLKEELSRLSRQSISRIPLTAGSSLLECLAKEVPMGNTPLVASDESLEAPMKKIKALEGVVAGSLRREQAAECAIKHLKGEIEQLNCLVRQREDDAQFNKMMLRFREDKIRRLEASITGTVSDDSSRTENNHALREELNLLRGRIDKNPELTRFAMENIRLMEQIQRLQDFYGGGEREILLQEISGLRDQLSEYFEARLLEDNQGATAKVAQVDLPKQDSSIPTTFGPEDNPSNFKSLLQEKEDCIQWEANRADELSRELEDAKRCIKMLEAELESHKQNTEAAKGLTKRLQLTEASLAAAQETAASAQVNVKQIRLETEDNALQQCKSLSEIREATTVWRSQQLQLRSELEEAQNLIQDLYMEKNLAAVNEEKPTEAETVMHLQLELESLDCLIQEERTHRKEAEERSIAMSTQLAESEERSQMLAVEVEELNSRVERLNLQVDEAEEKELELSKNLLESVEDLNQHKLVAESLENQALLYMNENSRLQAENIKVMESLKSREDELKVLTGCVVFLQSELQRELEIRVLEIDDEKDLELNEKLERTRKALTQAQQLNLKLESEQESFKALEQERELVRTDAEMETTEAITMLQSELVSICEDHKVIQEREAKAKQKAKDLKLQIMALQSELNALTKENARLTDLYETSLKERDCEISKLTQIWDMATSDLVECLAEGSQALDDAAQEMERITEECPSLIDGAMDTQMATFKERNLAQQQLEKRLLQAQKLAKQTENKVRVLSDATLAMAEMQRQEKSAMESDMEALVARHQERSDNVDQLLDRVQAWQEKAQKAEKMFVMACIVVGQLTKAGEQLAATNRRMQDSADEAAVCIEEKEKQIESLFSTLRDKDAKLTISQQLVEMLRKQVKDIKAEKEKVEEDFQLHVNEVKHHENLLSMQFKEVSENLAGEECVSDLRSEVIMCMLMKHIQTLEENSLKTAMETQHLSAQMEITIDEAAMSIAEKEKQLEALLSQAKAYEEKMRNKEVELNISQQLVEGLHQQVKDIRSEKKVEEVLSMQALEILAAEECVAVVGSEVIECMLLSQIQTLEENLLKAKMETRHMSAQMQTSEDKAAMSIASKEEQIESLLSHRRRDEKIMCDTEAQLHGLHEELQNIVFQKAKVEENFRSLEAEQELTWKRLTLAEKQVQISQLEATQAKHQGDLLSKGLQRVSEDRAVEELVSIVKVEVVECVLMTYIESLQKKWLKETMETRRLSAQLSKERMANIAAMEALMSDVVNLKAENIAEREFSSSLTKELSECHEQLHSLRKQVEEDHSKYGYLVSRLQGVEEMFSAHIYVLVLEEAISRERMINQAIVMEQEGVAITSMSQALFKELSILQNQKEELTMEKMEEEHLHTRLYAELEHSRDLFRMTGSHCLDVDDCLWQSMQLSHKAAGMLIETRSALQQLKEEQGLLLEIVGQKDGEILSLQVELQQACDGLKVLEGIHGACQSHLQQTLEKERRVQKEEMLRKDAEISELQSQIGKVLIMAKSLDQMYQDTSERLKSRDVQMEKLHQQHESLNRGVAEQFHLSNQELKNEVERLTDNMEVLQHELQSSCSIVSEVKESHSRTLQTLHEKDEKIVELLAQVEFAHASTRSLEEEIAMLKMTNHELLLENRKMSMLKQGIERDLSHLNRLQEEASKSMHTVERRHSKIAMSLEKLETLADLRLSQMAGVDATTGPEDYLLIVDEIEALMQLASNVSDDVETYEAKSKCTKEILHNQECQLKAMSQKVVALETDKRRLQEELGRQEGATETLQLYSQECAEGVLRATHEGSEKLVEAMEEQEVKLTRLQYKIQNMTKCFSHEVGHDSKIAFVKGCELVLCEVEEEVKACREQADIAWGKYDMVVNEKQQLEASLVIKENLIDSFQLDLAALQKQLEVTRERNGELDSAIRQLQEDVKKDELEMKHRNSCTQLADAELLLVQQKESLLSMEVSERHLRTEIEELKSRNSLMEEELEDKKHSKRELEMQLLNLESMIAQTFPFDRINHEFNKALKERDAALKERDQLHAELVVLNEQLEMAQQLAEEHEAIAVEARQIAEASKTQAEQKEEEAKLLERSVEELEITINALETQVGLVRDETERQRMLKEDTEMELQALRHQMSLLQALQLDAEVQCCDWEQTQRDLEMKHIKLREAEESICSLKKQCEEKDDQIKKYKSDFMELMSEAARQTSEHQQHVRALDNLAEQRSTAQVSTTMRPADRNPPKPWPSGSPFKCIGSGLSHQISYEIDEELTCNRQMIEELEALADSRQKEIFMLNVRLAEAESMTHDVIRDLVGVKLDLTNYANLQNTTDMSLLGSQQDLEKDNELSQLKAQLNEFIEERESWLEEINKRQAEMMAARVGAEKLRQRDQLVTLENETLKMQNASQRNRLIELEEEVNKLSGQQNLQQRIHHHAKIKEENNQLRLKNEDLAAKLRRSEVLLNRVTEELARHREADGKAPYIDIEEEQKLQVRLKEVEDEKMQIARKLLTLCTNVLQVAGLTRPTGGLDQTVAVEALKIIQDKLDTTQRELSDLRLKQKIDSEKMRLMELRALHSPKASS